MTPAERKAVAETLREWAKWCEANPERADWMWPSIHYAPSDVLLSGQAWIIEPWGMGITDRHQGHTAATGLYFAAAMVEAGDSV